MCQKCIEGKSVTRKVCSSSVKEHSTLFSCSVRAMYNIFNCDKKQCHILKSYVPGIDSSRGPKRYDNKYFSEKFVNSYITG